MVMDVFLFIIVMMLEGIMLMNLWEELKIFLIFIINIVKFRRYFLYVWRFFVGMFSFVFVSEIDFDNVVCM